MLIETGEIFISIKEALKKYPTCSHIADQCRGVRKKAGKIFLNKTIIDSHWKYVEPCKKIQNKLKKD